MKASVAELAQLPGVWRGGELEHAAQPVVATGHEALDRELPGGGWPTGTLSEVLHDAAGIGEVSFLAGALMRVGRVGRMELAVDDDDGDLAFPLRERIPGAEIGAERTHDIGQLRVVHIDLVRARQPAAGLDQALVRLLLLRGHLVVGDFGVASESGCVGHERLLGCGLVPASIAGCGVACESRMAADAAVRRGI